MSNVLIELLVIFILVLMNGFFAMSEMALVSSRPARLRQLAEEGSAGARAALNLAEDPGRFLPAVQIGITLIGVLAGAFSGATLAGKLAAWMRSLPALAPFADSLAIALVVLGITFLSLIVGELVPKRVALNDAERVASAVARPMILVTRLSSPLVWLLRISSEAVLRILGVPSSRQVTVTEEEVKAMVAEGAEAGVFHASERDMIDAVLRLADRPVRSIMTPRVDVEWLDPADSDEEIRRTIVDSGCSRFPVARDDIEKIEGVVHAKDLLDRALRGEPLDLVAAARQPLFVHEGTPVLKLIEMFRASPVHMALVVDEYGSFEGVVTSTDILTAIAGEFPEDEAEVEPMAVRRDDGSWLMDGRIGIDQVERLLGRRGLKTEGDYHTLAGFVLWELGRLPHIGEHLDSNGLRFEVVDMDGRRIDRVMIGPVPVSGGESAAA